MEELIWEISDEAIDELKKLKKPPYPLYYKNTFNAIAAEKGILHQLNTKLLCTENNVDEKFIEKTAKTIKVVSNVSQEIRKDSESLIEEVEDPVDIENIRDSILEFSNNLLNKVNSLQSTVESLEKELEKAYKELLIDPLTKVYNRKALVKDLNEILESGQNKDLDLYVAALDLDHFKEINDTYGHLVGDFVLIKVTEMIRRMIRKENKIYRYGGDEFIIIFNRMSVNQVKMIISRIIKKTENTLLKYKDHLIKVTLSIGIAKHKKGDTFEKIIKRADVALYEAKKTRNAFIIKE